MDCRRWIRAFCPAVSRGRFVDGVNGIRLHVLEAGDDGDRRPGVLLVHGFPELAYSWRKVMLPIAAAGYRVFAPDLRGYGRSGGTDVRFDDDLSPWATLNRVTDMVALVSAFGYRSVDAVIGHDFGSPLAAWCAVVRPDVFRSVVMMSAPFAGAPSLLIQHGERVRTAITSGGRHDLRGSGAADAASQALSALLLDARSRRQHAPRAAGLLLAFMRAYYHMKSADWKANQPHEARRAHRGGVGEAAALLHHGPRQGNGRDGRAGNADAG